MIKDTFIIEFVTDAKNLSDVKGTEPETYQAVITTLSKGFNLFKVTGLRKINNTGIVNLPGSYYLTSYPLKTTKATWRDPISFRSTKLLRTIGKTIETYLINNTTDVAVNSYAWCSDDQHRDVFRQEVGIGETC